MLVKRSHSVMIQYILNMHRLGYSIPCICCLWILICSWRLSLCGWTPYWQGSSSQRQCVDRIEAEAVYPPHLTHTFGTCNFFFHMCSYNRHNESTKLKLIIVELMKLLHLLTFVFWWGSFWDPRLRAVPKQSWPVHVFCVGNDQWIKWCVVHMAQ